MVVLCVGTHVHVEVNGQLNGVYSLNLYVDPRGPNSGLQTPLLTTEQSCWSKSIVFSKTKLK